MRCSVRAAARKNADSLPSRPKNGRKSAVRPRKNSKSSMRPAIPQSSPRTNRMNCVCRRRSAQLSVPSAVCSNWSSSCRPFCRISCSQRMKRCSSPQSAAAISPQRCCRCSKRRKSSFGWIRPLSARCSPNSAAAVCPTPKPSTRNGAARWKSFTRAKRTPSRLCERSTNTVSSAWYTARPPAATAVTICVPPRSRTRPRASGC